VRVFRIVGNRELKLFDAFVNPLGRALVCVVAPLEIEVIRLCAFGVAPCEPLALLAAQTQAQLLADLLRDLFLYREDVARPAPVLFAPQLRLLLHIN
jgi:hypothetical protein